jgi:hypothetical protein
MLKTFRCLKFSEAHENNFFADDAMQNFQFLKTCNKYTLHTRLFKLDGKIKNALKNFIA